MHLTFARRNLLRNKRRTLIILTAVTAGVTCMIVMAAFSRGTVKGMVENAIDNLVGHIRLEHPQYRVDPSIDHRIPDQHTLVKRLQSLLPEGTIAPRVRADAMLSTSRTHRGVMLVGIDPDAEKRLSFIGKPLYDGTMFTGGGEKGLIVGRSLLPLINGSIGRKVVLTAQNVDGENIAKAFRITGVFAVELAAVEKSYVFVPLKTLQDMLSLKDEVTEFSIKVAGYPDMPPTGKIKLLRTLQENETLSHLLIRDWREILPAISSYLQLFDAFMLIWYLIVFFAMAFGLVNTTLMAVYERMREFGLLQAIGMQPRAIITLVLNEMLLLLIFGCLLSDAIAILLINALWSQGLDLSVFAEGIEFWGVSRIIIPVITWSDILTANGVVIILGLLTGLYPAFRATRFTPVETMRHT